ncbi:MAG: NAD(P)/FAD-dependent oxidoreductase [Deltaproteobacteria bacterium]|nr:NAD(P)/FAD-dependent oxidoreductase [Deltaproteobacteria bacterium]
MKNLVILGAGTAGTMMANKLRKVLPRAEWSVTVLDRDADHIYQPGLLLLPFGMYDEADLVRPRSYFLGDGIELRLAPADRVDAEARTVRLKDGESLSYDVLIIATGTRIAPEATQGLCGPGWMETAFDFYTLEGASALQRKLEEWQGGRLVVNVVDMPIKCPVAPLEFLFLADAFFAERGIRDQVELVYATPLDGAFTKPRASAALGDLLEQKGVHLVTEFNTEVVDGVGGKLIGYDEREVPYDLLVTVPLHYGSRLVQRSELGDDSDFVPTHKHTLQSVAHRDIFVLGDATDLPTSKAGSVAHFQAEVLTENILRFIGGRDLAPDFDGHANCFIETGHGKAILIDFNYTTEPLPGRFPLPGIGPFSLLEESYVNHWGKLGFKWMYWNLLLRGEDLPIDHKMVMAGKWS